MIFQWHVRGGKASDDLFLYNCNGIILQNLVNVDLFWSIGFARIGNVLSKIIFSRCEKIRCVSSVFLTIVEGDQNIKYKIFLLLYSVRNSCRTSLFWPLSATAEPLSYCGQTCKSNLDSTLNDAKVLGLGVIQCLYTLSDRIRKVLKPEYYKSLFHLELPLLAWGH